MSTASHAVPVQWRLPAPERSARLAACARDRQLPHCLWTLLHKLRQSISEFRSGTVEFPMPPELAAAYKSLRITAETERDSLLRVSNGVGLAFLMSARNLTRDELIALYRDDLELARGTGLPAMNAGYRALIGE